MLRRQLLHFGAFTLGGLPLPGEPAPTRAISLGQTPPRIFAGTASVASLGEGLDALSVGLGDTLKDTVIVVVSEFGRTLRQNGNGGTDHGRGNVMWLMGGPVAGGQVLGDWPGLDQSALAGNRTGNGVSSRPADLALCGQAGSA